MSTALRDTRFYIDELLSEECQCGAFKKRHHSFCYKCYRSLPGHYQQDLWQRMGDGYEQAYDEACTWLNG